MFPALRVRSYTMKAAGDGWVSELDRPAGPENLTKTVFGPHSNVRLGNMHRDSGLEAVSGGGPSWPQLVGARAGERLPGGDLRGTVPAGVECYFVIRSGFGYEGWGVCGMSLPGEAERAV